MTASMSTFEVPLLWSPGFKWSILQLRLIMGISPVFLMDYKSATASVGNGAYGHMTGIGGGSIHFDFGKNFGLLINGLFRASPGVFAWGGNYELRDQGWEFSGGAKYALR